LHRAAVVLAAWAVASLGPTQGRATSPDPDNCGAAALLALARAMDVVPTEAQSAQLLAMLPGPAVDMLQLQEAARAIGLELIGVEGALDQVAAAPGPKVLHLLAPVHFSVLVRLDASWAQVMEGTHVSSISRSTVERRYSGRALLVQPVRAAGVPQAAVRAFHHEAGITGVGQVVEHAFSLRNAGEGDLHLRLDDCPG